MNRIFTACIVVLFITACTSEDKVEQLQAQNDSLRQELVTTQNMLFTFKEVGSLIDSIDISRNALRVNIVEGTPYFDYTERLGEINNYVKRSENKIDELEKKLRASKNQSNAYELMVMALKDELAISRDEVVALEAQVSAMMKDNKDLSKTVKLQKASLEDFQLQLDAKYEEVKLFAVHIKELTEKLEITEANASFAQAEALEKAARKTKLAPKKKRKTYQEALTLYKKAQDAGHPEAANKIKELEKKI